MLFVKTQAEAFNNLENGKFEIQSKTFLQSHVMHFVDIVSSVLLTRRVDFCVIRITSMGFCAIEFSC